MSFRLETNVTKFCRSEYIEVFWRPLQNKISYTASNKVNIMSYISWKKTTKRAIIKTSKRKNLRFHRYNLSEDKRNEPLFFRPFSTKRVGFEIIELVIPRSVEFNFFHSGALPFNTITKKLQSIKSSQKISDKKNLNRWWFTLFFTERRVELY